MATMLPTVYQQWLLEGQSPPLEFRSGPWLQAVRSLTSTLRALRQDLVREGANWSTFERWLKGRENLEAVLNWGEFIGVRTGKAGEYTSVAARAAAAFFRLRRSSARHPAIHVLRGWLRRSKDPLKPIQRHLVETEVNDWAYARTSQNTPIERLSKSFLRRDAAFTNRCTSAPLQLRRDQVKDLPAELRQILRRNAQAIGRKGWCVAATSDEAAQCLALVNDETFREQLWRQQQALKVSDADIAALLTLRRKEAKQRGHTGAVSSNMEQTALGKPRQVLRWLRRFGDHTAHCLLSSAHAPALVSQKPWDLRHQREHIQPCQEPAFAFPVEATIDRVMPRLLSLGGWSLDSQTYHAGAERFWQFKMTHVTGRRAEVWLAPFQPLQESIEPSWYAGLATAIHRGRHDSASSPQVVSITLSLSPQATHFTHNYLGALLHEMGHAMHGLAIDPSSDVGIEAFPQDLDEFPSQLLEQMATDPHWLASIAQGESAGRFEIWEDFLRAQKIKETAVWRSRALSGEIDLVSHMSTRPATLSFTQQYRQVCARQGVQVHEDDRSCLGMFRFDHGGGMDYTYTVSMAMAERFVATRDDGSVDAERLLANFDQLCHGLLRDGTTIPRFRRAWKNSQGQPLVEALDQGFEAWITRCFKVPAGEA